ncbi:MAG: response regulator [Alphaproteobacteria bacterium]|nr:response regulator [Alphaproteobacteria bacterium]
MTDSQDKDENGRAAAQARLAHRINNAVSYVVTNLNLVLEELEGVPLTPQLLRIQQLVIEAASGADRVGDLVRELRLLEYGQERLDDSNDDTWDEERRRHRILVVDDEPFILASIRRALQRYDVVVAEGGQAAEEALRTRGPFDLVLCDLVMPPYDGPKVYQWIVEHQPELVGRVIFMTAGAFTNAQRTFLHAITNPVLHKPFDTKTLRWAIAQSLRARPAVTPATRSREES